MFQSSAASHHLSAVPSFITSPFLSQCPADIADLVELFRPGLWTAVAEERLGDVRRLLNLWCRVDLRRQDLTLRRLALDTGNESIISLILNIEHTMVSEGRPGTL